MSKFTFGQYKGQNVDNIIQINPKYVLWAHENVSYFKLTPEQLEECKIKCKEKTSYYSYRRHVREETWADDYDYENDYSSTYESDMRSIFDPNY